MVGWRKRRRCSRIASAGPLVHRGVPTMPPTAPTEAPAAPALSPLEPLPPIDPRPLFPGERAALLELLADLPPEPWMLPTVCTGWSVKDVAAHLLADDLGRLSGERDDFANPDFAAGLDVETWGGLVAAIDRQ